MEIRDFLKDIDQKISHLIEKKERFFDNLKVYDD